MNKVNETQPMEALPGERGMPAIGEQVSGNLAARKRIAAFIVMGALLSVGAYFVWRGKQEPVKEEKRETQTFASPSPAKTFGDPPKQPREGVVLIPTVTPGAATPNPPTPPSDLLVEPPSKPQPRASGGGGSGRRAPTLDKGQSPLMAGGGSSSAAPSAPQAPSLEATLASLQGFSTASATPSIEAPAKAQAAQVQASFLGDRNFLLAQGSFIDCVLQTRIDSTVPGMTSCVVSRNIFSDNGKVLLIERGSTISGEYQEGIQQGQKRLFVIWNRLKTPNGVVVNLESPATDPLGGAGIPGRVQSKFFARVGAALLLSLVDDAGNIAASALSKGDDQVLSFGNTAGAAQGAAQEIVKNTINVKPVLSKNQGEVIGVYVARDIDFSGVYRATSK